MVLFTSIWKSLGHTKADVVRLIESQPDSESLLPCPMNPASRSRFHSPRLGFWRESGDPLADLATPSPVADLVRKVYG